MIAITVISLVAAIIGVVVNEVRTKRTYTIDSTGTSREVLLIEGCEYVRIADGGAHKGNCKACLQRQGLMKAEREAK
jgi:hypothetical protein